MSNDPMQDNRVRPLQQMSQNSDILNLEEHVKLHEATLAAWRQRRDQILVDQELASSRKQQFLNQRARIQERKAMLMQSQEKNSSLQQSLQDSLLKSRERLQRLTTLEAMIEEQGAGKNEEIEQGEGDAQGNPSLPDENDVIASSDKVIHTETRFEHGTDTGIKCNGEENHSTQTFISSLPMVEKLDRFNSLQHYHSGRSKRSSKQRTVVPFLPSLEANRVEEYLLVSQREGNALDVNNSDLSTSDRRKLLDNTCLDIFMLATINSKRAMHSTSPTAKGISAKTTFLDPNLSLCPYELAGVCADDLCPYQHTVKQPNIIARERLPLPDTKSLLRQNEGTTILAKQAESNALGQSNPPAEKEEVFNRAEENGNAGDSSNSDLHEVDGSNDSGLEEEFMVLPPAGGVSESEDGEEEMASENSVGSDDNEASLPISGFSTNQLKPHSTCERIGFWWEDELSSSPPGSSLSISSILKDLFGIVLHQVPLVTNEIRIEVIGTLLSHNNCETATDTVDICKILGRLVDALRLCVHAGRFDVAKPICEAFHGGRMLASGENESLVRILGNALQRQVHTAWDFGEDSSLSLFELELNVQANMAMISWLLQAAGHHLEECPKTERNERSLHLAWLSEAISDLDGDFFGAPVDLLEGNFSFHMQELKTFFTLDEHSKWQKAQLDVQIEQMKGLCRWARLAFLSIEADDTLTQRLVQLWTRLRIFLNKLHSAGSDDENRPFCDTLKNLQELKVSVAMGIAILGCLSLLASNSSGENGNEFSEWHALDEAIYTILKSMPRELRQTPMLELVMTPMYAASTAASAFLRHYSTSQQRLENYLHLTFPPLKHSPTSTLLSHSELLWSQLIQLRMSLPGESPFVLHEPSYNNGNNPLTIQAKNSPWEPSVAVKDTNRLIRQKIELLEILMHHVVLWGDELLLAEVDHSKTHLLLHCASSDGDEIFEPASFNWNEQFGHRLQGGDTYAQSYYPLSPLPFQVLILGHVFVQLNLSHASLHCIPQSFGLYFPNTKTLDLSHNRLKNLPDSFRYLQKQMESLEIFLLNHNLLETLPDEIFSITGKGSQLRSSHIRVWNVSHNRLKNLPPLVPNAVACLEELWLDHNCLTDMTIVDLSRLAIKLPTLRHLTYDHQTRAADTAN
jgi:hypothetical protein